MSGTRILRHAALAVLLILVAACSSDPLRCPPNAIGPWNAESEEEVYVGDDLFIYINGGAEIYHEYGFAQVAVTRYVRGEDRISVEIYTMTDSAFGIYSFARSQKGQPLELANGGTAAEYYVHLWGGRDMAVVTAENDFDGSRQALLEIAGVVAGCLSPGGGEPELTAEVPPLGRPEGLAVLVKGQLAFINAARPAAPFFSGFESGVVRSYVSESGEEIQAVLLMWPDETAAAAARKDVRRRVEETEDAVVHSAGDDGMEFTARGHRITAAFHGKIMSVTITKEET